MNEIWTTGRQSQKFGCAAFRPARAFPLKERGRCPPLKERSGSTKQVLRGAELNRFLMRKHGRTWDDVPLPGIGVKDLDGRAIDEFRRLAAASERLPGDVMEESDAGVIEKLNLREGRHLKRAAALLFHSTPERFIGEAFVKVGYFRGSELLSYRGMSRVETFPVPRDAMREAVVNAVIHRDYTLPAPSQIRVYDDRIMLWNPGRLPEGWSLENLTGNHPSQPPQSRDRQRFLQGRADRGLGPGGATDHRELRGVGQSTAPVADFA